MANIVELQVFYRTKDGDLENIKQAPSSQETNAIKLDVARIVNGIKQRGIAEYWYLVVKAEKQDGSYGYRTMIPKTLFL